MGLVRAAAPIRGSPEWASGYQEKQDTHSPDAGGSSGTHLGFSKVLLRGNSSLPGLKRLEVVLSYQCGREGPLDPSEIKKSLL